MVGGASLLGRRLALWRGPGWYTFDASRAMKANPEETMSDDTAPSTDPNDKPTSQEEFAKAQREGTTVGHEVARRSEEQRAANQGERGWKIWNGPGE